MASVLIVAKTRTGNACCVGGLELDTNKSIRLLNPQGRFQPLNTEFNIGDIWELDYCKPSRVVPPHVEDIFVTKQVYVNHQPDLKDFLLPRTQPWQGEPSHLFDGLLNFTINMKGYISRNKGIPNVSTGFWLPDRALWKTTINDKVYFIYENFSYENGNLVFSFNRPRKYKIPYVGCVAPIDEIPANTLLRVSLARWWPPEDREPRCYLQLSGWYM